MTEMSCSNLVNSVGLALDIVGAVFVWRYGLPEPISRKGAIYLIAEQTDEAERARAAKNDVLSKIGLGLLIGGFLLQLASNFIATLDVS